MLTTLIIVLSSLALFGVGWLVGRVGFGSRAIDPTSLDAAERAFIERMRDVTLVGSYTELGRETTASTPDRYAIASVEKVGPRHWRFNATLTCCGLNGDFPVVVPMEWVGDTPMIMMTDTSLPGLGTFSVRIFFYRDRYSGTWQHGARGGFMSGQIERRTTAAAPSLIAEHVA